MMTAIYIGSERVDLYKEDNIVINNSVAKSEDITKVFTDVSYSFSVPASDNNNKIFKHYYNSDVLGGFDARKKVDGVIEIGGLNYKVGKFKLNKVLLKGNKPDSYNIDFFGNLVALKDVLKDDHLKDLDLSSYDFDFTYNSVSLRLTTDGDTIMSLFADKRYVYDSVNTIVTTDKIVNIAYNGTGTDNGINYTDPKVSIKNIRVIEAIENDYGISFSRDFFGSDEFIKSFLLLSKRDMNNIYNVVLPLGDSTDPTLLNNTVLYTGEGTPTERETTLIECTVTPFVAYVDTLYSIAIFRGVEEVSRLSNVKGTQTLALNPLDMPNSSIIENATFKVYAEVFNGFVDVTRTTPTTSYLSEGSLATTTFKAIISNIIPEIKTIDYLKGLFQLYKLVAIPQKDGSIYVNTLERYYSNGVVHDLSNYIDYEKTSVSVGKLLNEISYKFEEPSTILNKQFKQINGVGYGDLSLTITDDNGEIIDGEKLDYSVPFEQVVYEKIYDIGLSGTDTGIQYALLTDENISPQDIKAHIHYNYTNPSTDIIKVISEFGIAQQVVNINSPIHTNGIVSPLASTTFGSEFNEFTGNTIANTLYSNHHQKYITGVFSEKKREYKVKAKNVPSNIIINLNLNDVILIKDKYYRVDNYDVNIITREIDFNLITSIDLDLTPYSSLSLDSTEITLDSTLTTLDTI